MEKEKTEFLLNEYSKLYTCAVSDAIDEIGIEPGFLDSEIRPIWHGARMIGFAGTMKMVVSDEPLDRNIIARFIIITFDLITIINRFYSYK